jgi:hypothetical protein
MDTERILDALHQINVNLESLRVSVAAMTQLTADHEERLRGLERWKHQLTPILATLTFVLGAVASQLLHRII